MPKVTKLSSGTELASDEEEDVNVPMSIEDETEGEVIENQEEGNILIYSTLT